MIVVLLADLSHDWSQQVRRRLGEEAVVLEGTGLEATLELLQSVRADLVITEMLSLVPERLASYEQMADQAPNATLLCIAPDEVIDAVRRDQLPAPDLWLRPSTTSADWEEIIANAIERATLQAEAGEAAVLPPEEPSRIVSTGEQQSGPALDVFHRLMAGFSGGFDLHNLLDAYVDSVAQFVHCAAYCLLWEEPTSGRYGVHAQRGLRDEIQEAAGLSPTDALPTWYRRNSRVIAATELAGWSDQASARAVKRELDLFCGQLAVPVMVRGRLAGVLVLGDKVLGDCYAAAEIETLFAMSNYVGLAAESIELHEELRRAKASTDRIVDTMSAGLITLGADERIRLCNPYAARVLDLDQREVAGADLRCLPSPLGDLLYAALTDPAEAVSSHEISIRGGEPVLRVSTAALLDEGGNVLGSVMLLDDVTAEIELARERSESERREVLTRIVGRVAHEVKNPLTAVKTYAELLDSRGANRELEDFWRRTVRPEIDHLDDLISNLVRMVEQPPPNPQPAHIEDLVQEAVQQLEGTYDEVEGFFDVEVAEGLPMVHVDPKPMRDALRYFLRCVSGPPHSPVHIAVTGNTSDGDDITVTMRRLSRQKPSFEPDTVFDPLYVIEHLEADLGPVIGHNIITSHDGNVEAACEDGQVIVRIVLPLSRTQGALQGLEVT